MKKQALVVCLLAFGIVVGVSQFTPAFADSHSATRVSQARSAQPGDDAQDAKTFVGRIAQVDGKYVLVESTNNTKFMLDDQEKAKQFDGKNVKVKGTLDTASNTIHVLAIQAA